MPEKKRIIFRRIRGRIVPIRADVTKGTTLIGAGSGIILGSGAIARALRSKSKKVLGKGFTASKLTTKIGDSPFKIRRRLQLHEVIRKSAKGSIRLTRAAKGFRITSLIGGSALISAGIEKFIPRKTRESEVAREFSTTAGGIGAALLLVGVSRTKGFKALSKVFRK